MSNIWRRSLSMFLALVMVFGMLPVNAFATETGEQVTEETSVTEPVNPETTAAAEALAAIAAETEETTEPVAETTVAAEETTVATTAPTEAAVETTEETTAATDATQAAVAAGDVAAAGAAGTAETTVSTEPEETEPVVTMQSYTSVPDMDLPSDEELFEAYAEQQLYGSSISTLGIAAGARLSGNEKKAYDALVPYLKDIASGKRASATIALGPNFGSVNVGGTYMDCTPDEMVDFDSTTFNKENLDNVLYALLSDLPYDLYWFDKVTGVSDTVIQCGDEIFVFFYFTVAANYRGADKLTVDTAITGAAAAAAAAAQDIVDKYGKDLPEDEQLTDYEKLVAYKDEILELASYDHDAAKSGDAGFVQDDDPWQVVHIFDGDDSTKVVCEGYSKAFQYLCDLTEFESDITCYSVTGVLSGENIVGNGAHMWNIIEIEGVPYLVDLTNSEEGTVGADGSLFMAGKTANADGSYTFGSVTYTYDDYTKDLWDDAILVVSESSYVPAQSGTSDAQTALEEALAAANGATYTLEESITLTRNLEVNMTEGNFVIASGVTLTVPSGVTLIVNGSMLLYGDLVIQDGGKMISGEGDAWGDIYLSGGDLTIGANATLDLTNSSVCEERGSGSVINGTIPADKLCAVTYVTTEEKLIEALAVTGYVDHGIIVSRDITTTGNITVPAGRRIQLLNSTFTVGAGKTLTVDGTMIAMVGSTLQNEGIIQNNGSIDGEGSFLNFGTVNGKAVKIGVTTMTQAEFEEALANASGSYWLGQDVTITSDVTIPAGVSVWVADVGSLTVASGATLTANSQLTAAGIITINGTLINNHMLYVEGGTVTIGSSGNLQNNKWINVYSGTMSINGSYAFDINNAMFQLAAGATLNGTDKVGKKNITLITYVATEEELVAATYAEPEYREKSVQLENSISLKRDLTIPAGIVVNIGRYYTEDISCVLSVENGATLTNNGIISTPPFGGVHVAGGSKLINKENGYIGNNGEILISGEFQNSGTLKGNAVEFGDAQGRLEADLAGCATDWTLTESVTVNRDMTIYLSDNTFYIPEGGALIVPSGKTLYINSDVRMTGGKIIVEDGGKLVINAGMEILEGVVYIADGGSIENNGWINGWITHEGDTETHLATYWVHNYGDGLFENHDYCENRYGMQMTPGEGYQWIFYLNVWNEGEKNWDRTPIHPSNLTTSGYVEITPMTGLDWAWEQGFKDGENQNCFAFVEVPNDSEAWDTEAYIAYNYNGTELRYEIPIQRNYDYGFYSSTVASNETWLNNVRFNPLASSNVFYFILTHEEWNLKGYKITQNADKIKSISRTGNVLKITLDPAYTANAWMEGGFDLGLAIDLQHKNDSSWTQTWYPGTYCEPMWTHELETASLNINNTWYEIDGESGKAFAYVEGEDGDYYPEIVKLPTGVSYDYDTNTLTLNNAKLENLYAGYSYIDDEGNTGYNLPTDSLTVKLVGASTISNDDDCAMSIDRGLNVTITGDGSLNLYAENSPDHVNEEGNRYAYPTVGINEGSSLTITGKAKVTAEIAGTGYHGDETAWMHAFCGNGSGEALTISGSAKLDIVMPEGARVYDDTVDSYSGHKGIDGGISITVADSATLNADGIYLYDGAVYTQTGGTVNIDALGGVYLQGSTGITRYSYNPVHIDNGTFNMLGGVMNINAVADTDWSVSNYNGIISDYGTINISGGTLNIKGSYYGCALAASCYYDENGQPNGPGSTLNISGGTVKLEATKGWISTGIYVDPESSANFTGGTIHADYMVSYLDGNTTWGNEATGAGTVYNGDAAGIYTHGPAEFHMYGGQFNLKGVKYTQDGEEVLGNALFEINGNGVIYGGEINLTNGVFRNNMVVGIEGGEITINNTWADMPGMENNLYLPITGGKVNVTANGTAIHNPGTFHQMGGVVTAVNTTSEHAVMVSTGSALLNDGILNLSGGYYGLVQNYNFDLAEDDVENNESMLFVGAMDGDDVPVLNISNTKMGVYASAPVDFHWNANVNIDVKGTPTNNGRDWPVAIFIDRVTNGDSSENVSSLLIDGGSVVNLTSKDTAGVDAMSKGIVAWYSPVDIRGFTDDDGYFWAPSVTIDAEMAVYSVSDDITNDNFVSEVNFQSVETGNFLSITSRDFTETEAEGDYFHTVMENGTYAGKVTVTHKSTMELQEFLNGMAATPEGERYQLNSSVTIDQNVTLSSIVDVLYGAELVVANGATLYIPENYHLVARDGGRITVQAGGRIVNEGILANDGGTITVNNTADYEGYVHGESADMNTHFRNNVVFQTTGIPYELQNLIGDCANEDQFYYIYAMAANGYRVVNINYSKSLTLKAYMTVPENVVLNFNGTGNSTVTLTVPKSKVLTVNGRIELNNAALSVVSGGKVTNNGGILLNDGSSAVITGTMVNNGFSELRGAAVTVNGTLENNSRIYTWDNSVLTVGAMGTLTQNGEFSTNQTIVNVQGKFQNNSPTFINDGSTLNVNGTLNNKAPLHIGFWKQDEAEYMAGTLNINGTLNNYDYLNICHDGIAYDDGNTRFCGGVVNVYGKLNNLAIESEERYGFIELNGAMNVEKGAVLTLGTYMSINDAGVLTVRGSVNNQSGIDVYGTADVYGTFNNNGSMWMYDEHANVTTYAGASLVNNASIRNSSRGGSLIFAADTYTHGSYKDMEGVTYPAELIQDYFSDGTLAKVSGADISQVSLLYEGSDEASVLKAVDYANNNGYCNYFLRITDELTISEGTLLTIDPNCYLNVMNNGEQYQGSLMVNGSIVNQGYMRFFESDLTISEGGRICNEGYVQTYKYSFGAEKTPIFKVNGILENETTGTMELDEAECIIGETGTIQNNYHDGALGTVNGVDNSQQTLWTSIHDGNAEKQLRTFIDKVKADGYQHGIVWLMTEAHITQHLEIPENVTVRVCSSGEEYQGSLTVDEGGFLLSYGYITVDSGSTLTLNGQLVIYSGVLNLMDGATLVNNDWLTNVNGRAEDTDNGESAINAMVGSTIINNGAIDNGIGILNAAGNYQHGENAVIYNSYYNEQTGTISGGSIPMSDVTLSHVIRRSNPLHGEYTIHEMFNIIMVNGYGNGLLQIYDEFQLQYALTIPENVTVQIGAYQDAKNWSEGELIVGVNAVLTNHGKIQVTKENTLTNHGHIITENGGILTVEGAMYNDGQVDVSSTADISGIIINGTTFFVEDGGVLTATGIWEGYDPINVGGTISGNAFDMSQAKLEQMLKGGEADGYEVVLRRPLTLEKNLTINGELTLAGSTGTFAEGGTITVPSGVTLTINGRLCVNPGGKLIVEAGGKLVNNGQLINNGGSIQVSNVGYTHGGNASVQVLCGYSEQGELGLPVIEGISTAYQTLVFTSHDEAMIGKFFELAGQYQAGELYMDDNLTLSGETSDLYIPENVTMQIYTSAKLVIPEDVVVHNDGHVWLSSGATVEVNGEFWNTRAGGTLAVQPGGVMTGEGTVYAMVGSITNQGEISCHGGIQYVAFANTAAELTNAINSGVNAVHVAKTMTLSAGVTIPEVTTVIIDDGVTLTINTTQTIVNRGTIVVSAGGVLNVIRWNFGGNRICAQEGSTVNVPAGYEGIYYIPDTPVESIELMAYVEALNMAYAGAMVVPVGVPIMPYVTQITPSYCQFAWFSQYFLDENEEPSYDSDIAYFNEEGMLIGTGEGTVTLRAKVQTGTEEGADVYDDLIITFVEQKIQINNGEIPSESVTLFSGDKLTLTAAITPDNMTNTSVVWELADNGADYATLTVRNGIATVTAKTLTEAHDIQVLAKAKDGSATEAVVNLKLRPKAQQLAVTMDGENVTGKTVKFDLNYMVPAANDGGMEKQRTKALTIVVTPSDAFQEVEWTISNKNIVESVVSNGNGSYTVNFLDKTGTVKLTATATDGSKKTAAVTIQTVELLQTISAEKESDTLIGGQAATYYALGETGSRVNASLVKWYLCDENGNKIDVHPYASINANGRLTTKTVAEPETVYIQAEVVGNETKATEPVCIELYPAISKVEILHNEEAVNTTLRYDFAETEEMLLNLNIYPDAGAVKDISWKSSNDKIASINEEDGIIPTGTAGTVTFTATVTMWNGAKKTASCQVQFATFAHDIKFYALGENGTLFEYDNESTTALVIYGGQTVMPLMTKTFAADVETEIATGVTWSLDNSTDSSYLTVASNGKLTAKAVSNPADVNVAVTSKDGNCKEIIKVHIEPKLDQYGRPALLLVNEAGEYVTKTTQLVDIKTEGANILKLKVANTDVSAENVDWTSSNQKVAEVVAGIITVKAAGTATITAKAADGRTATVTIKGSKVSESVTIADKNGNTDLVVASGKTLDLVGTVLYSDGTTDKSVVWSVSDDSVAKIAANGRLTATANLKQAATVTVYAAAKDNCSEPASITVTVKPLATGVKISGPFGDGYMDVTNTTQNWNMGVTFDDDGMMSFENTMLTLNANVYPFFETGADEEENPANAIQKVTWTSSNAAVASIDENGNITCHKAGTVTITAAAADGSNMRATFKLTVLKKMLTVTLAQDEWGIAGGKSLNLSTGHTVFPTDTTNKKLVWEITGGEGALYATINSSTGVLTTKAVTEPKTLTVQATAADGYGATTGDITVTIYPITTAVQIRNVYGETVTNKTLYVNVNGTLDLDAIAAPGSAWQNFTWTSSNGTQASVDADGIVTGIAAGRTVTITAKAQDGSNKQASVKVMVVEPVQNITFADNLILAGNMTLKMAQQVTFNQSVKPTVQKLAWEIVEGAGYATINANGDLKAKNITVQQNVVVGATATDGSGVYSECTVTLYPATTKLNLIVEGDTTNTSITGKTVILNVRNNGDGDMIDLSGLTTPASAYQKWQWTSSDKNYATVNEDGVVQAVKGGKTVTITAKALDGSGKSATVRIQTVQLMTGLEITTDPLVIAGGKNLTLKTEITPSNTANKKLNWEIVGGNGAEYVTSVANGVLRTKAVDAAKTVTVRATAADGSGVTVTCSVTIYPLTTKLDIQNESTTVTGKTITMAIRGEGDGDIMDFDGWTTPDGASKNWQWTTSDKNYVTVDENGVVEVVKGGKTVTITAKALDGSGKSATVRIQAVQLMTDLSFNTANMAYDEHGNLVVAGGKNLTLKTVIAPANTTNKKLTWSIDNTEFATITNGVLKTKAVTEMQTVTITAAAADGSGINAQIKVNIYPATTSLQLWHENVNQTSKTVTMDVRGLNADGTVDGDQKHIDVMTNPTGAYQNWQWSSSDKTSVAVDEYGNIQALKGGKTVTITAKALDGTGRSALVRIQTLQKMTDLTITNERYSINGEDCLVIAGGRDLTLKTAIAPANTSNKKLTWSIDNTKFATITNGVLKTKAVAQVQTVTVMATAQDGSGETASCIVKIYPATTTMQIVDQKDTAANLTGKTFKLNVRDTVENNDAMAFTVNTGSDSVCQQWQWISSDSNYVTVDQNGNVKAIKGGKTVTITAKALDGTGKSAAVRIQTVQLMTGLDVTNEHLLVASGKSLALKTAIAPANTANKKVTWTIVDGGQYATITSAGVLTAKTVSQVQKVTVQVTAADGSGLVRDYQVSIYPITTKVQIVTEDEAAVHKLCIGEEMSLSAMSFPEKAAQAWTWTSSNKNIATVDADGNVTGIKAGTVTITCKAVDGSGRQATVKVQVVK